MAPIMRHQHGGSMEAARGRSLTRE